MPYEEVQEARGSSGRTLIDMETAYKTLKAYASRKPRLVPFNTNELGQTRPQNESQTMTWDRNPVEPFYGFKDVAGALTVPVDTKVLLYLLKSAINGTPNRREVPATAANILSGSDVTVTIESGEATFSAAQAAAAAAITAGNLPRVIYRDSDGVEYHAYMSTTSSSTVFDVITDISDIDDAEVVGIVTNQLETTGDTITITDGVATFSAEQTAITGSSDPAGMQILYDTGAVEKRCYIVASLSDTTASVVDGEGFPAPDCTAKTIRTIEAKTTFRYTYKVHPTAKLPSFLIERLYQDIYPNVSYRYRGCKVNSFELAVGGDGEMLATLNLMGAVRDVAYMPYDCEDVKTLNGTANPTIALSSGTATIGTSQTSIAVGQVIVYRSTSWTAGDPIYYAVVATKSSGTSVTLVDENGDTAADIVGAEIIHLYDPEGGKIVGELRERFEQFDFDAWEGSIADSDSTVNLLEKFSITVGNNLEGDRYVIGGGGERRGIPAARVAASGNISALFDNDRISAKAQNQTTSALRVKGVNGTDELDIRVPEVKFEEKDPGITTPGGTKAELGWKAFKTASNSEASAVAVTVRSELFM